MAGVGAVGRVGRMGHTSGQGGGASAFAPYAAPSGYFWDFVFDTDGAQVVDGDGSPVVDLVRN